MTNKMFPTLAPGDRVRIDNTDGWTYGQAYIGATGTVERMIVDADLDLIDGTVYVAVANLVPPTGGRFLPGVRQDFQPSELEVLE